MSKKNQIPKLTGTTFAMIGVVAFVVIGVLAFTLMNTQGSDEFMSIEYKTDDGKIIDAASIGTQFSMIGETYGISDIRFTVNVKNTGNIPLVAVIESSSPNQLSNALSSTSNKNINPGDTVSWQTDWIATDQFEGTTPNFGVVVRASDSLGRSVTKSGSKSIQIMPDPEIGIEVTITDSEDSGSGTDPNPDTCTNECDFYEHSCVSGNVYNCATGSDGCKDLILVENCGSDGCSGGQCMAPAGCIVQTQEVFSSGSCVFDCRSSEEDCSIRYSGDAYARSGYITSTVSQGTYVVKRPAYICTITMCK